MKRIVLSLLLPLLLLLTLPALAAEKEPLKDYIFRGMPDYQLESQQKNFDQLKIKSPKPESKDAIETTYEGNIVYSNYYYKGKDGEAPSQLQVRRYYQAGVEKLGGQVLWDQPNDRFCASFTRNDKQYYLALDPYNNPVSRYDLHILEVAKLNYDVEIIDSDTILHKLDKEGHIALYINFDTGKATLKPDAAEVIDEIVAALKSKPELKVKLEGHTDNVGDAAANKKLSDDRANAVMAAIAAKGIDKSRLSAEGFGLEKPIADNNTEEGRAKNRRVELVKM